PNRCFMVCSFLLGSAWVRIVEDVRQFIGFSFSVSISVLYLCCSYSMPRTVPAVSPGNEEKRHQTKNHSTEAFLRGQTRDRDSLRPGWTFAGHPAVRLVRGVAGRAASPPAP